MNQPLEESTDIIELAHQLNLDIPILSGLLSCVFVGQWNSGKSSLINNLIGANLLPVKANETTFTVVRLNKNTDTEPSAKIHSVQGDCQHYTGMAAVEALQQATQDLPSIDFASPTLDLPTNTVFIDTPGFNSQNQSISSKAESVNADIVVFVLQGIGATLNETEINFIQQIRLTKADLKDFFFVVTYCESLDEQDRPSVEERFCVQQIPQDRLFFVSNTNQDGVAALKTTLYTYLNARQADLFELRRRKYIKQTVEALQQKVATERAVIAHHKEQNAEDRKDLLERIREAKEQERRKKSIKRKRLALPILPN